MTPEEFVSVVRDHIVNANVAEYHELLEHTSPANASDPYWRSLLELYGRLPAADRAVVLAVMRQVASDTVSTLLGAIDGSCAIGLPEGVTLVTSEGQSVLSGSLQDMFLLAEEINESPR